MKKYLWAKQLLGYEQVAKRIANIRFDIGSSAWNIITNVRIKKMKIWIF